MENYKNPITTQENINELHHILVQTCLDYMVEHGLTDIDEIDFTADGLSVSYNYKEWTPATDSYSQLLLRSESNAQQSTSVHNITHCLTDYQYGYPLRIYALIRILKEYPDIPIRLTPEGPFPDKVFRLHIDIPYTPLIRTFGRMYI